MQTVLEAVRDILGQPDFYIDNGNYSSTWDYGLMLEYVISGILLCVVVSWVFRFISRLVG